MSIEQVHVRQEEVEAAARLTYLVRWSAEDFAWLASASEIRAAKTHGASPHEALANAIDVAALWLAAFRVWGVDSPNQTGLPPDRK